MVEGDDLGESVGAPREAGKFVCQLDGIWEGTEGRRTHLKLRNSSLLKAAGASFEMLTFFSTTFSSSSSSSLGSKVE